MRGRLFVAGLVTVLVVAGVLVLQRIRAEQADPTGGTTSAIPRELRPGVTLTVPAGTETVVRLVGSAGDVLVASTERLYSARELRLRGPLGDVVEPAITAGACFDQGVWLLPDDGEYLLAYAPGGRGTTTLAVETTTPVTARDGQVRRFDLARRNQVVAVRVATGLRGFTATARSSRAGGYVGGRNGDPLAGLLLLGRDRAYARRSDRYSMRARVPGRGELGVTGPVVVASMACVNGPARLSLRVDLTEPRRARDRRGEARRRG